MKKLLASALVDARPCLASATIEPFHTCPGIAVEHWGRSMLRGQFDTTAGKFGFDRAAKAGAVELLIAAASITAGDGVKGSRSQSRDDHLRSGDRVNVAELPTMTFQSTKATLAGDLSATVEGKLTRPGASEPVTLSFERFKCGGNRSTMKDRCGGNVVGRFKRSDFGTTFVLPAVGDAITLNIEFEDDRD